MLFSLKGTVNDLENRRSVTDRCKQTRVMHIYKDTDTMTHVYNLAENVKTKYTFSHNKKMD